jgi:uncharacterized protein
MKMSLPVRLILAAIRAYKLLLSPYLGGGCRFLPSCADYSAEAFARHGLLQGLRLTIGRLARCHPLCEAGYDPVPEARRPSHRTGPPKPAAVGSLQAGTRACAPGHHA